MTELTGFRAIVTGGASGIGPATAELLAERGAEVAVPNLAPGKLPQPLAGPTAGSTTGIAPAVDGGMAALRTRPTTR